MSVEAKIRALREASREQNKAHHLANAASPELIFLNDAKWFERHLAIFLDALQEGYLCEPDRLYGFMERLLYIIHEAMIDGIKHEAYIRASEEPEKAVLIAADTAAKIENEKQQLDDKIHDLHKKYGQLTIHAF